MVSQKVKERDPSKLWNRVEELLAENYDLKLLDLLPVGITILDLKGVIVYCNPAVSERSGYPNEEYIGRHFSKIASVRIKDIPKYIRMFSSIVMGKVPRPFETVYQRKDGTFGSSEVTISIMKIGGKRHILVILHDITERKQAEEALWKSNEMKDAILNATPDYIAVLDEKLILTDINERMAGRFGKQPEELIGKHGLDLVPPELANSRKQALNKVLQTGQPFRWEDESKGTFFDNIAYPMYKKQGRVKRVGIIARDITERKRAEEQAIVANERLRYLLSSSPAVVYSAKTADDYGATFISDNITKMVGYEPREFTGNSNFWIEHVHPDDVELVSQEVPRLFEQGQHSYEYRFRRKDGVYIWIRDEMELVRDEEKKPLEIVGYWADITERKTLEESMARERQELSLIIDSSPIIVFYKNTEGRFIRANKAFAEALHITEEEFVGKTVFDLYSTNIAEIMTSDDREVLQSGHPKLGIVEQYESASGLRWVLTDKVPIFDANGLPAGLVGFAQDITERKRAEFELTARIKELRCLYDVANISGNPENTLDERYQKIADKLPQGWEYPEITCARITMNNEVFKTENYQETEWKQSSDIIVQGEKVGTVEVNYLKEKPAVDEGPFLKEERLLIDAVAERLSIITEHKLVEGALQEDHEYLKRLTNSMGDAVFSVKMPGRVIEWVNDGFKIFGYDADECIGKTTEFLYPDNSESRDFGNKLKKAMAAGKEILYAEQLFIRKSGEVFPAEVTTTFLNEKDEVVGISSIVRDISERKRIEEERQRIEKLESIGTLAGGIAHDFNNLLTGIMGNIGLAKRGMRHKGMSFKRLEEAEKAAVRARNLTQQLLTFGQGSMPVKKLASISELIREIATFALRGSNTGLEFSLPDDLWVSEIDEGQISQVIHNIVINADEAMPPGGTVNISASNAVVKRPGALPLPKGNYLRIDIEDEGIGMSKEQVTRIFEPYYTTKQKGSGLGLATAYSIIKNHGGYITTDSKYNVGTTFHIYLPASEIPAPESEEEKEVMVEAPIRHKGRILVMDDQEIIREMLSKMLPISGYQVELTGDGAEAIKKYADAKRAGKPFDAVIMDLTVPGGMGGREAIKKLLEVDPDAKVIVSSGYSTDPIMSEYKEHGFSAIINKPYSVSQMEETLRGILK